MCKPNTVFFSNSLFIVANLWRQNGARIRIFFFIYVPGTRFRIQVFRRSDILSSNRIKVFSADRTRNIRTGSRFFFTDLYFSLDTWLYYCRIFFYMRNNAIFFSFKLLVEFIFVLCSKICLL